MAPTWLIEFKVKPRFALDRVRLWDALAQMASQETPFEYSKDARSGRVIIKVADDLHLDMIGANLKRTHMLEVSVGAPKVAYRETLARPTEADRRHRPIRACEAALEPNDRDAGNKFESVIVGEVVPKEFITGVERGVRGGLEVWPDGLSDGRYKGHTARWRYQEIDSSAVAFEIAASTAMRNGATSADARLLEPIMDIEVVSPGDFIGSVIGDLNRRRGQISSQEMRGSATVIVISCALGTTLKYRTGTVPMIFGQLVV